MFKNLLTTSRREEKPLPSPKEIKAALPASPQHHLRIAKFRQEVIDILEGKDKRLLLIVGPCSIHDLASAKEYARKLKQLSENVQDTFFIIMRVYCEKARTTLGWKGLLYDPTLDHTNDIESGIKLTRKLLLELTEMGLPAACEFVDPLASHYIEELITWGSIGARTTASQVHRQFASGLPMPIGFKNSTDGNIDNAIHGLITAAQPHTCIGFNEEGTAASLYTQGNMHTHIVLRGGEEDPNFDAAAVNAARLKLKGYGLPERIIIDCAHDNSERQHHKQPAVFEAIIEQTLNEDSAIVGLMLESHLHAGRQHLTGQEHQLKYGISVTDPCLDWETTEQLILNARDTFARVYERVSRLRT